jgi:prophage regulatory protein
VEILRSGDVIRCTGLSRTTIWRLERAGKFPRRLRLSANSVGWSSDEIEAWLAGRPRGMASPLSNHDQEGTLNGR